LSSLCIALLRFTTSAKLFLRAFALALLLYSVALRHVFLGHGAVQLDVHWTKQMSKPLQVIIVMGSADVFFLAINLLGSSCNYAGSYVKSAKCINRPCNSNFVATFCHLQGFLSM